MKRIILITIITLSLNYLHAQSWQYAHAFGGNPGTPINGSTNNNPYNLITDDHGNAYVYGTYGAFTAFNDTTILPSFDNYQGSFIVKYNCAGEVEWYKAISKAEQNRDQASHMILKDSYLYLMGSTRFDRYYRTWFIDTLIFGNQLHPPYTYPYQPTPYTYIIKMDAQTGAIVDCNLLNLKSVSHHDNFTYSQPLWMDWTNKRGFTIDDEGNYYIPANFSSEDSHKLYCNNNLIIDSLEPGNMNNIGYIIPHILKFDSTFNLLWYKPLFSHTSELRCDGVPFDITDMYCSEDNNIYMTGYAYSTESNMTYDGSEEIYYTFPLSLYFRSGDSIRLDHYENEVGYLLKMDSEGDVLWCRQSQVFCNQPELFNGCGKFQTHSIYEDSDNIYVSGYALQYIESYYTDFGLSIGVILGGQDTVKGLFSTSFGNIGIVVNYDLDGNYKGYTSPKASQGFVSRVRLHDDELHALASCRVNLEHGDTTYYSEGNNSGLALCSWDRQFNPVSSINIPSEGNPNLFPQELSINNRGEIAVTGNFDGGLTFGDHHIMTGGRQYHMFIAKYGFPCGVQGESDGEFCYGDIWEGITLTHSGDYTFTYPSSIPGIDSIHTLHATVIPQISSGIEDFTACKDSLLLLQANTGYDSYLWSNGATGSNIEITYNQIGEYNLYVTITQGLCSATDSIVITVENCQGPIYGESNGEFCYGEVYEGVTLTSSGNYIFTYPSSIPGVDSIHTLHAIVMPQITSGIGTATGCRDSLILLQANTGYDSYLWSNGTTGSNIELIYNQAGFYTLSVTMTQGNCSASETIVITVENCPGTVYGESSAVFCYGDVWEGITLTQSGDYTFTYPTSIPNVDSVHTLHATVQPQIISGLSNSTVCRDSLLIIQANTGYESYLWSNGATGSNVELLYSQAGVYPLSVTITQGICSSTESITITVENCPGTVYGESSGVFCYGDVWEGITLTQSGDYTFTYPTSTPNVDSVHTLHATVIPQIISGIADHTICKDSLLTIEANSGYDSYLWSNGATGSSIEVTYSEIGAYGFSVTITQDICSITESFTVYVRNCGIGIEEYEGFNIMLYPNPVTDICRMDISNEQLEKITIFDIYGREVAVHTSLEFSTKELSAGIYIVKVITVNGKIGQKKMIKQ